MLVSCDELCGEPVTEKRAAAWLAARASISAWSAKKDIYDSIRFFDGHTRAGVRFWRVGLGVSA